MSVAIRIMSIRIRKGLRIRIGTKIGGEVTCKIQTTQDLLEISNGKPPNIYKLIAGHHERIISRKT
jgi:hypothetical protein